MVSIFSLAGKKASVEELSTVGKKASIEELSTVGWSVGEDCIGC